jgi:hypothetical protein
VVASASPISDSARGTMAQSEMRTLRIICGPSLAICRLRVRSGPISYRRHGTKSNYSCPRPNRYAAIEAAGSECRLRVVYGRCAWQQVRCASGELAPRRQ